MPLSNRRHLLMIIERAAREPRQLEQFLDVNLIAVSFAVTMTVHCAANLVEDLGLSPQRERRELSSAEGVN
nr:hypothetical protein [Sinorhizobium meliloti]